MGYDYSKCQLKEIASGFTYISISVFDILHGLAEDVTGSFDYSQKKKKKKKKNNQKKKTVFKKKKKKKKTTKIIQTKNKEQKPKPRSIVSLTPYSASHNKKKYQFRSLLPYLVAQE
ncbi:hypothetical protein llap_12920 [Limosa lapponica baueri]|uniref:Uncharacterized protein n=1 Tax=Limosa lapponica baueri TaxID=1758121 RepID=A0A2I0TSK1_LIMLA|nr:hypothetical protein llap_12920 [Limosa lapponica baueri]